MGSFTLGQPFGATGKAGASQRTIKLPCPSDVDEAAALIAEGDGCGDAEALRRALEAAGFPSASALARAHAARIEIDLDRLPPPCDAAGDRLLRATRRFLGSPSFVACVVGGWPLSDIFGVDEWSPLARPDVLGLVPAAALAPKAGRKLEAVTAAGASFRDPGGRAVSFRRPSLFAADAASAVLWWRCAALQNAEAA
jgi:hypothetical protein